MKRLSKKEYDKLLRYTKYHVRKITDIEAEDILHEVAFKVFSKVDFESTVENVVAYLYSSIKNKIIELARKPKKLITVDSLVDRNIYNESFKTTKNIYDNIEIEMDREELYQLLYRAVQQLPPMYQSVIIATGFEGKTIKEFSKETDIPMGTLLSRRHRALSKLHDILENDFNEF
ncbi:MAG: sigma-70 family RNA polymerase sigma factor [Bacteroidales bacterium]